MFVDDVRDLRVKFTSYWITTLNSAIEKALDLNLIVAIWEKWILGPAVFGFLVPGQHVLDEGIWLVLWELRDPGHLILHICLLFLGPPPQPEEQASSH